MHVEKVLRTTVEGKHTFRQRHVAYLANCGKEVLFDAEHYFDGFRSPGPRPLSSGRRLTRVPDDGLCDTTVARSDGAKSDRQPDGARVPHVEIGIHTTTKPDAGGECLLAIEAGATHVQGTINGVGDARHCDSLPPSPIWSSRWPRGGRRRAPQEAH